MSVGAGQVRRRRRPDAAANAPRGGGGGGDVRLNANGGQDGDEEEANGGLRRSGTDPGRRGRRRPATTEAVPYRSRRRNGVRKGKSTIFAAKITGDCSALIEVPVVRVCCDGTC